MVREIVRTALQQYLVLIYITLGWNSFFQLWSATRKRFFVTVLLYLYILECCLLTLRLFSAKELLRQKLSMT
jgi:hypothetical protein